MPTKTVSQRKAARERTAERKAAGPAQRGANPIGFQRGNEHGRAGTETRLRQRPLTQMLISRLQEATGKGQTTRMWKIIGKLLLAAEDGNLEAIKFIFDRVDGKVPLAITGADGESPLQIEVIRRIFVDAKDNKMIDVTPGVKPVTPTTRTFVDIPPKKD